MCCESTYMYIRQASLSWCYYSCLRIIVVDIQQLGNGITQSDVPKGTHHHNHDKQNPQQCKITHTHNSDDYYMLLQKATVPDSTSFVQKSNHIIGMHMLNITGWALRAVCIMMTSTTFLSKVVQTMQTCMLNNIIILYDVFPL